MRHQNMRLGYGQERLSRFALEVPNHASGHVLNIDSTLAQIRVVDLTQRVGVTLRYFLKNIFNIAAVGFEFAQNFIDERSVFHHEQMRIENTRILGPDRLCDALLHLENLPARLHERGLETRNLFRDVSWFDPVACDIVHFVAHDVRATARDARSDSDTLKANFLFRALFAHLAGRVAQMSIFVKASFNQLLDFVHRLIRILSFAANVQLGTLPRSQHHQTHDAFSVDLLAFLIDPHFTTKAGRDADEHGRGPRMQPEAIHNRNIFFYFPGVASSSAFAIQKSHQFFSINSSNFVLNSRALFRPIPFNF